jgi:hypothetical protein
MFVNEQSLRDWNLTIYYYSLNSAEFCITIEEIEARTADLEEFLQVNGIPCSEASLADKHTSTLGELSGKIIKRINSLPTINYPYPITSLPSQRPIHTIPRLSPRYHRSLIFFRLVVRNAKIWTLSTLLSYLNRW